MREVLLLSATSVITNYDKCSYKVRQGYTVLVGSWSEMQVKKHTRVKMSIQSEFFEHERQMKVLSIEAIEMFCGNKLVLMVKVDWGAG